MTVGEAGKYATMDMVTTAATRLPPCLKEPLDWQLGLSFNGKTLQVKRKCPMCMAVYTFDVAIKGNDPPKEVEWDNMAEKKRTDEVRGCCSEAIVFILGMIASGMMDQLLDELFKLNHALVKAAQAAQAEAETAKVARAEAAKAKAGKAKIGKN